MKTNKQKRIIRIIAIILSITMILSVVYSVVYVIIGMAREEANNKKLEELKKQVLAQNTIETTETVDDGEDSESNFEVVKIEK